MKKQKQAAETEETLSAAIDDRISHLPRIILHHILCFLSQKEAVRTCLLSKQWRHIGTTRPNLEFFDIWFDDTQERFVPVLNLEFFNKWFDDTQERFISVLDRTLQGYLDQNLSIHKLHLHLWIHDSRRVISLLHQWIPTIAALNIKAFKLHFHSFFPAYYDLPSTVFLAESLEELHLCDCKLSPVEGVRFKHLHTLTLERVQVDGGTLGTKTLECPLLRRLVLNICWELRNVWLSDAPGLKHFVLSDYERIEGRMIEIDVPNIETIFINGLWIWSHHRSPLLFSRLTSLHLRNVILSSESIDMLSFGCPILESLALLNCSGFEEFHLASDSVKFLRLSIRDILVKGVTICAPNILNFMIIACIPQALDTFSFTTTTSKEWDSYVILYLCEDDPYFNVNSWFIRRMLEPLSGSRIDLTLHMNCGRGLGVPCGAVDDSHLLCDEPPLVVENLEFGNGKWRTQSWYLDFTKDLFRVCRPRHVWDRRPMSNSGVARNRRLSDFQFNILLASMSLGTFWRHDLEQVHVKTVDGEKWQLVEWTDLSELQNGTYDGVICVKLKWRGQNCETGRMDEPFRFSFSPGLGLYSFISGLSYKIE
ncbi:F-box/RNI-like superfamily protein [Striga asiatica]|uniref:F-box/RNI-like superfamily protein n=1 Tax=Striga asiatica TaxID=4170 RepID=A0A5A7QUN1_STRAF|nr:F-box/RNI-like superfamily protein [Striga asiatica]